MKENVQLMRDARSALKGHWWTAVVTFLVYMILTGGPGILHESGTLASLLLAGPVGLGAAIFSLAVARGEEVRFELLFEGFNDFVKALATYLWMLLIVLLFTLLLIVPGIIKALSYSMTFYILADNRSLKPREALDASKQMMDGYKLKLFYLILRFLLLALLCILTLGIGFLWLVPYVNVTIAMFYEDIKGGSVDGEFV